MGLIYWEVLPLDCSLEPLEDLVLLDSDRHRYESTCIYCTCTCTCMYVVYMYVHVHVHVCSVHGASSVLYL